MEDLKKMTVGALRELARKHLGSEDARGKTRAELTRALKGVVERASASADRATLRADLVVTITARRVATTLRSSAEKVVASARRVTGMQSGHSVRERRPPEDPPPPRKGASGEKTPLPPEKRADPAPKAGEAKLKDRPHTGVQPEPHPAEPLVEGFFVARVAGEEEARRHRMVEEKAAPVREGHGGRVYDEKLGELPAQYEDDAVLLLPRDPHTLFFFWDFHPRTRQAAAEGLVSPRAVLRVFDGDQQVREVDFALESKSYYLHDLTPGRAYRVEACFVGRDGQSRRVGLSSSVVALPALGPSSNTEVRFLHVPWGLPLVRLKEYLRDGRARLGAYLGQKRYLEAAGGPNPHSATLPGGFSSEDRARWAPTRSGRSG